MSAAVGRRVRETFAGVRRRAAGVPLFAWLAAFLTSAGLEVAVGERLADAIGLDKVPALFGMLIVLDEPARLPHALLYVSAVYVLPAIAVTTLLAGAANGLAARLLRLGLPVSLGVHLGLAFAALHLWTGVSDYRLLVVRLVLVAIIATLSLNVVNGYMGEFSCSHPGFMALGAYAATVVTVGLLSDSAAFGPARLPAELGPLVFPVALVVGGVVASASALVVAVPSFKTRGDYLAIISLAFMFIVKSLLENLEFVGGPRGLGGQPDLAGLPAVFGWTVAGVWVINTFVRSTFGKALNAVRDDETAAAAMSIDTRRTKMTAFLFAAFWAGVAGGLLAHIVRYVNPSSFGIQKLAEVLAMVYFGGLNSVVGSIVGATSIILLGEMLRPLQIMKWIVIPLLLILVMIFRPTGLVAFRELDARAWLGPRTGAARDRAGDGDDGAGVPRTGMAGEVGPAGGG